MRQKIIFASTAILVVALMVALPLATLAAAESTTDTPDLSSQESILETYGKLPLLFIPNQGQVDEAVRYYVKASGQTLYFTDEGIAFDLIRYSKTEMDDIADRQADRLVFSLDFLGANSQPAIEGSDKDSAVVNYFIGNDPEKWRCSIPTYSELIYQDIYPNIDLRLYGSGGRLRYDFIVKPGGTPNDIALAYHGIDSLAIIDGELVVGTAFGDMVQSQPYIYQQIGDEVVEVEGDFRLGSDNAYGFHIGTYDAGYPLIIDPVLAYSTYLGGSNEDQGHGIAVDSSGCAYITGYTDSADFPTQNPYQGYQAQQGYGDVFVTKLSAAGNALVYSTYLGGSNTDEGYGIAVDSSGCAYVTGYTDSDDFPTQNPYQDTFQGDRDAFVAKLSAAGNSLVYSTYLGGSDYDYGYSIAVDSSGCAYVTGTTHSDDFPTQNPYQDTLQGDRNAFVTKLSAAGDSLAYSTYLGGSNQEYGYGIAVDSSGCAYVTGDTSSDDFPTNNPFQQNRAGGWDVFVTKLSADGNSLVYSTYLGGSTFHDLGRSIAVDSSGCAYVTGYTYSTDFPTQNPYQDTLQGGGDAFVAKLSATGSSLVYSTYLGGSGGETVGGIAVDSSGCAYVTGTTDSGDFPIQNPYQTYQEKEIYDYAFVAKLSVSPPAVGGTAYPINKLAILAPWIALAAAVAVGIVIVARRRRAQS
jgi:hypothetical protein